MTGTRNLSPESCAIAFKEWAGICRALAEGRQCVILRKGGIEEGPGGFAPEHVHFWLYPTHVHEAEQGLRIEESSPSPTPAGFVEIDALAEVVSLAHLERPDALDDLAEFHVWTEETVAKRFQYRKPGLWVLGVRVSRRDPPWRVEATPAHAGCKSWVPLEAPLSTDGLKPVLDASEFAQRMDHLRSALTQSR